MRKKGSNQPHRRDRGLLITSLIAMILVSGCAGLGATTPPPQPGPDTTALVSPTDGATGQTGAVTISFAAHEFERQIYEPLIKAFNEQNRGIQVQFVALDDVPGQSLDQQM